MNLVTYRKNNQGFYDRQIKNFDKFPSKEECNRLSLVVAHPMSDYKIELHKKGNGNYHPNYDLPEEQ